MIAHCAATRMPMCSHTPSRMRSSEPQRSATVNGVADVGQTIAGALGQQIGNTSIQLTQRQLAIPPTLEVPPGYIFDVLVDRDIVLSSPYNEPGSP